MKLGRNYPCASVRQEGFSLLELLVLLLVIAFLSCTLFTGLAKSRPNSLAFQCMNNHRQMCAAWRMYADDNRDRIVYASDDGTGTNNPLNQYVWTLTHLDSTASTANWDTNVDIVLRPLWPYTGRNAAIYRCPADPSSVRDSTGTVRPRVRSNSMNIYLGGFAGTTGGWASMAAYRLFFKTTELGVIGPTRIFVFLDERWDMINWGNFVTDMSGYPNNPSSYLLQDLPSMIHNLGAGFSFADGRAEIHRWRDPRTTPPLGATTGSPYSVPRDADVAWLQDHATRPSRQ